MTPRGVCRIIMVAIILIGSGIGPMFSVTSVRAVAPAPAAPQQAALPDSNLNGLTAQVGGVISCTSKATNPAGADGIAGRTVDGTSPGIGERSVTVTLVTQDVQGNEVPVVLANSINPQVSSNTGNPNTDGYWSFKFNNEPANNLKNVTLKFEEVGRLTEYFDRRYDITTSTKITITQSGAPGTTCIATDGQGRSWLNNNTQILVNTAGGIAGRVTVAIPPISLSQNGIPDPIVDESIPITGGGGNGATILVYTNTTPLPASTPYSGTTDASGGTDGYYRIGNIPPGQYVVKFVAPGYIPSTGTFWRDGGFNFLPYSPFSQNPGDPYYTRIITIPSSSPFVTNSYVTVITPTAGTDDGSYQIDNGTSVSLVHGINGHLAQPASIKGQVQDIATNPVPGATVELYNAAKVRLSAQVANGTGNYNFTSLTPSTTYFLKATPPLGVQLVPRWYPSNDQLTAVGVTVTPSSTGGVVSTTANIVLVTGARFSGTIVDFDNGTALPGIKAQVFRATDDPLTAAPIDESADSDAAGNYTTNAVLEPGVTYKLAFVPDTGVDQLHASNFCGDPLSGSNCNSNASFNLSNAHVFTAAGSGQTTQANIRLVAGSRIAGSITSPRGWTTAGLQVQVYVLDPVSGQIYQTFQVAPTSGDPTVVGYSTGALVTKTYILKFVPLQSSSNTGFVPVYYSSSSSTGTTDIAQATGIGVSGTGAIFPGGGANVTLREGGQINLHVQLIDLANPGQTIDMANTLVEIYGGVNPVDAPGTKLSSGTTDQNGNITFRGLDTTAPNAGNPFAIQILPNSATKLASTWVTVTPSSIKDVFNLTSNPANSGIQQPLWLTQTLYQGSSIGGHIYDPNNLTYDFSSTVISLYDNNKKLIRSFSQNSPSGTITKTVSGNNYYYKIVVPPGTYYLGFTPPITSPNLYSPFFYPNSTDLINDQAPNLQSIAVGVNQNLTTTDALFTPKGRIKFVVVNSTNQVQSNAQVTVYNASKQVIPGLTALTDINGVYTTTIINAGASSTYYASALKGGASGYYNGHGGPFDPNQADPIIIQVGPSGAITPVITITLLTGLIATGTVSTHPSSGANRPLAGVQVSAIRSSDNGTIDGPTTTDANGQYSLIAIPLNSSYYLKYVWQDPSGNVQTTTYHDGTTYGTKNAAGATVFNNVNVSNKNVTFNLSASLNGTIYQKNGGAPSPMVSATISIIRPTNAASVYAMATSKADGSYLIPNLPPGNYKIQFVSNAGTGSITAYYFLNQAGGTFQFSQGTTLGLNDLSPQRIDQTFDLGPTQSIASCLIGGAMPVSATLNSVAINFNGNCSGTGKIYVNLSSGVATTTAAFNFSDSVNAFNHTIVATSGSFPPDTNLYVKVAIISGTQEYSNYPEIIVRTAAAGDKWYFPYGDSRTTSPSVNSEFLHIFNYNTSSTANITVSYIITGAAPIVRNFSITPGKRTDIEVSNPADANSLNSAGGLTTGRIHATYVSADIPIMVERSIYNYSTGVSVTGGTTWGGSAMPGSPSLSNDWNFADGTSSDLALGSPNYNTFFTIFNPSVVSNVCVIPFLYTNNSTAGTSADFALPQVTIGPGQFVTVSMLSILSKLSASKQVNYNTGFATRFSGLPSNCNGAAGSAPFVAEQTSQYAAPQADGSLRKGEINLLGATSGGLQWYFMEGLNDKIVSRTYHLLNTTAQAATVTFTVQLDNPPAGPPANLLSGSNGACGAASGSNPLIVVCTVQPSRRLDVQVNDANVQLVGRTFGFSVNILSNQPIVVERGMKFTWRQIPVIDGLFGQMAINRVANTWLFAAGSTTNDVTTGKLADMALNVYNSNNAAVRLKITYYTATSGSTTNASSSFYLSLDGLSRTTIRPSARTSPDYPSVGPNQALVAVKIESVDINDVLSLPVLAERVIFWNWPAGGNIGNINMGNASFGYIPPGS